MNEIPPLDKKAIAITSISDSREEDAYWHSRTPMERWEATEIQRRMIYGEARTQQRLQRF